MLIVLDLNGSIAIKEWCENYKTVKWTTASNIYLLWNLIVEKNIKVILWSSAFKSTIIEFVKQCVPDNIELLDIFSVEECNEDFNYPKYNKNGKNIATIKDLNTVWEKYPEFRNNTIIFDDEYRKVRLNENNYCVLTGTIEQNIMQIINKIETFSDNKICTYI